MSYTTSSKTSSSSKSSTAPKRTSQSKIQLKTAAQRSHPGMASSQNRATAHYGAVNGLRATADGFYLLSSGKFYFVQLQYFLFFLTLKAEKLIIVSKDPIHV
jgi:hypothetical protein